jgi:hypothetical protein
MVFAGTVKVSLALLVVCGNDVVTPLTVLVNESIQRFGFVMLQLAATWALGQSSDSSSPRTRVEALSDSPVLAH